MSRQSIFSYTAGGIFGLAWWIWIDANLYATNTKDPVGVNFGEWLPAFVSSLAMVMINLVSRADLNGQSIFASDTAAQVKAWMFLSFFVLFGGLVASFWIAIQFWFASPDPAPTSVFPGVALILSNVLITFSAIIYRFRQSIDDDGYNLVS